MGATFLLVLLPIVAALGFMLKTVQGEASGAALLAGGVFLLLTTLITVMVVRMAKNWDDDSAEG
jgi:hypothetical protein